MLEDMTNDENFKTALLIAIAALLVVCIGISSFYLRYMWTKIGEHGRYVSGATSYTTTDTSKNRITESANSTEVIKQMPATSSQASATSDVANNEDSVNTFGVVTTEDAL